MNKTMKKTLFFSNICLLLVVCMFSSCTTNDDNLDEALLIGKWQLGTLYETYSSDHTYITWDTADDVTESEARKGKWTLEKKPLLGQFYIIIRMADEKVYHRILSLKKETFMYKDSSDNYIKKFTKVLE